MRRWLIAIVVLTLVGGSAMVAVRVRAEPAAQDTDPWTDPYCQTVFFAVLEGLYQDGVPDGAIRAIADSKMAANFVYACPLCHPVFQAFRLYIIREPFYGDKAGRTTFVKSSEAFDGEGRPVTPPPDAGLALRLRQLKDEKAEVRVEALQSLVDRWVRRRLDLMRLTPEERAEWTQKLAERREQGMKALKASGGKMMSGAKQCPTCDGAAGACKPPAPPSPNH